MQAQQQDRIFMWDTSVDIALAAPPATVAVMTVMGLSINDFVSVLMLIWAACLVVEKAWRFALWLHRRGWLDWRNDV